MARSLERRIAGPLAVAAVAALLLSLVSHSFSQEKAPRAQPRGRLPAYYAKVVTEQQREQVYQVQAEYENQIDTLEAKILELEKKRDDAVRALLTPEQRRQVDQLAAAAKAERDERRAQVKPAAAADAPPSAPARPTAKAK
ncbi:MAG: hypothetical protein JNG90_14510 [Planctomycetaceae bacterium]|nr:hypothetical protein [Planctomycetaceae bacterium]